MIDANQRDRWTGPMVWEGGTLSKQSDWIVQLSEAELDAIQVAIASTKVSGKPIGEITRNDFQLGEFGQRLLSIRDEVVDGRGFVVIRGLAGRQWDDADLARAYWGIGTWVGDAVSQNAKAHLLGHVIDQMSGPAAETRLYQTNKAQPYHSDSCDIVGLLCLRPAKQGGASSIASSAAIHNALLDTEPELLEQLYGEFYCDRFGEIPEGKLPSYPVHVFNKVAGKLVCCGMDPDIRSAQRLDGVEPLTAVQLRALDAFQSTASQLSLNMSLQRGDIQLVSNLVVVHGREQFEDYAELDKRRYLVRLWLSSPLGRRLPEFMRERWGNIEVGSIRGGIRVPGSVPVVHLDPDG